MEEVRSRRVFITGSMTNSVNVGAAVSCCLQSIEVNFGMTCLICQTYCYVQGKERKLFSFEAMKVNLLRTEKQIKNLCVLQKASQTGISKITVFQDLSCKRTLELTFCGPHIFILEFVVITVIYMKHLIWGIRFSKTLLLFLVKCLQKDNFLWQ